MTRVCALIGSPSGALLTLILAALCGCGHIARSGPTLETRALPPAESGDLARLDAASTESLPPGHSAFVRIPHNEEAFRWRLELIDRASTSIDAQYFIWKDDETSQLLFLRLLAAADRGVRVRLLLDDIWLLARDRALATAALHPSIEIRIFNPARVREASFWWLGEFALRFRQLNRRMHNKLFVADNRVAVVGGRNIGNEYFGFDEDFNFRDLDVVAMGPVVGEISSAFDDYWNSELSVPAEHLDDDARADELVVLRTRLEGGLAAHRPELASLRGGERDPLAVSARLAPRLHSGTAHFLQDDPDDVDGADLRLIDRIREVATRADEEMLVVSPYFVPRRAVLDLLDRQFEAGAEVTVLTAALESTNHTLVHAHYKKHRRRILETGANLYEYRAEPDALQREKAETPPTTGDFVSLHSKVMVADRRACFVGSLNLDPRAVEINTENGLYIESEPFCGDLASEIDRMVSPANAWRVDLDERGRLRWTSDDGTRSSAPARGVGQRISDFFYRWLPLEGQL